MPTNPAVSRATPSDLGPTSSSWSLVLRQWILPAAAATTAAVQHQDVCAQTDSRLHGILLAAVLPRAVRSGVMKTRHTTRPPTFADAPHHLAAKYEAGDCPEKPPRRFQAVEELQRGRRCAGGCFQHLHRGCGTSSSEGGRVLRRSSQHTGWAPLHWALSQTQYCWMPAHVPIASPPPPPGGSAPAAAAPAALCCLQRTTRCWRWPHSCWYACCCC